MSSPTASPAVVILDVLNLRGSEGRRKDSPFRVDHFDEFVAAVSQALPNAVIVGIVDGTAAQEGRKVGFASKDDRRELLRRTNLDPSDPQYLHLLPPPEKRWGWRKDLRYLPADPVCVHLLEMFPDNSALITFDLLDKESDVAYFPEIHELRHRIFVPFWLRSENSWVFLAREEVSQFGAWNADFFEAAENHEILRIEELLVSVAISERKATKVRQQAYGYVHDCVNEHRAAGNRIVPLVLRWQRPRSAFDVLNPRDFEEVSTASTEQTEDELIDVGASNDSDVLVRVTTEQIDLIRSIDELQVYVGKRVGVQAMLQIDGDIPYLTWLGRSSRVAVTLWSPSAVVRTGFVRLEGVLTSNDGRLTISVASPDDLRYSSVGDAVSARLARLVKRDVYASGGGKWNFPRLPRRPSRRIPPPPPFVVPPVRPSSTTDGVPATPSIERIDEEDRNTPRDYEDATSEPVTVVGSITAPKHVETEAGVSDGAISDDKGRPGPIAIGKPDTDLPARRTKWRMLAWIATACVVAAAVWFVLQTYVFAFEIPDPAVCANLEPEVCEAIIAEWQGDALRIHLYGTRGADGVVR